jgi:hypothetical protein
MENCLSKLSWSCTIQKRKNFRSIKFIRSVVETSKDKHKDASFMGYHNFLLTYSVEQNPS